MAFWSSKKDAAFCLCVMCYHSGPSKFQEVLHDTFDGFMFILTVGIVRHLLLVTAFTTLE